MKTSHVVTFCDVPHCDGLEDIPLMHPETVAIADTEEDAIGAIKADFERRDAEGAVTREFSSFGKKDRNSLWVLRGAGPTGTEIHAGFGEATLYRSVAFRH